MLDFPSGVIEKNNQYVYRLFRYLENKKLNKIGSFSVRYLPQYKKGKTGVCGAVLVVYPMAMDITVGIAGKMADKITKIKAAFDKYTKKDSISDALKATHVPK